MRFAEEKWTLQKRKETRKTLQLQLIRKTDVLQTGAYTVGCTAFESKPQGLVR
jgi:hypothetical protein